MKLNECPSENSSYGLHCSCITARSSHQCCHCGAPDADEIQSLPNTEGRDETMTVKRYRKKPVVIEAIQFAEDRHNEMEARDFLGDAFKGVGNRMGLGIATLEGSMFAAPGDYIIKGVAGEFYPCKPDIFKQTYEEVKRQLQARERGCRQSTSG